MNLVYNEIGTNYNLTRKADPFLAKKLVEHLTPKKDGLYLDIGCGTGNYTDALQKKGYKFIGIDPSEKMLNQAKRKNSKIEWKIGSAESTGLSKNSLDGITASLTIHHWTDLSKAFIELTSILKPNGKLVIFTSTPKQMKGYWLNHYFRKMLADSMLKMPTLEVINSEINAAGLLFFDSEKYFVRPDLEDQFLYCGKHNPELYFDSQIRQGISSFSSLANQNEVSVGLSELRVDIERSNIDEIIKRYKNDFGDYLFVIAEKPTVY